MKLIIISSPEPVAGEADQINALLDEGLEIFHLRKLGNSAEEMGQLISKIKPVHLSKISIHSHHEKAGEWGINRLHFQEHVRMVTPAEELVSLAKTKIVTTSLHALLEFQFLNSCFSYAFFGPVFASISKQGYKSEFAPEKLAIEKKSPGTKCIAIGGIDENNISEIFRLGFDGAGLLGSIWNEKDPVVNYRNILQAIQLNQLTQP